MVTTSGSIRKMFQRIWRDSKLTITESMTASLPAKHEIQPSTTHLEHAPTTNIQTKALVVMAPGGDFTLLPITLDEVRPDEVLVEMKASGICHTDLILQQVNLSLLEFPAILGHEGAGIIRAVGSNVRNKQSLHIGSHVLLSFHACGKCRQCRVDPPCFCHRRPEINHNAGRLSDRSSPASLGSGESVRSQYFGHSSFARMSVVPADCVIPVSVDGDNDCLDPIHAPLGCGFQTGAGTILNVLRPSAADSVVIFGLGSVGLTALMAAISPYCGARAVLAVDIQDTKLALASELGATVTINSRVCPDVVQRIKKETHGGQILLLTALASSVSWRLPWSV